MIDRQDLQELVGFSGESVVSLYLDTDIVRESKEKIKLVLRDLLSKLNDEANAEDLARITRFFDFEYDWQGRGVAVFSCQDEDFWRVYSLPVPLSSASFVGDSPYVKPLADVVDKFGSYGVVIVDREGVRMFHIRGGRVMEETETSGQEVKHHKQGGWAQSRYQRSVETQAFQNLKQAADAVTQFCKSEGCEHLILGGTEGNISQFRDLLPTHLEGRIAATLPVDRSTGIDDILERSWDIMQEVRRQEEEALVNEVVTSARKGGLGVTGLADTLYRLHEGRVRVMIVSEELTASGYRCSSCGYVAAQDMPRCLFCGGEEIHPVDDAVDHAVHKAVESGVDIEVVDGSELLEEVGGIGAALRY